MLESPKFESLNRPARKSSEMAGCSSNGARKFKSGSIVLSGFIVCGAVGAVWRAACGGGNAVVICC